MTIAELAIKRPSLVLCFSRCSECLGYSVTPNLNISFCLNLRPPIITIATIYPGASPSEVETSVSKPIEDAV